MCTVILTITTYNYVRIYEEEKTAKLSSNNTRRGGLEVHFKKFRQS